MSRALEVALALSAFIIVNLATAYYQPRITYRNGREWDGIHYHAMAESLREGHLPEGKAPFIYRFGLPLLASLVPTENILDGFLVANLIGCFILLLLLLAWLRIYIEDWRVRLLLIFLFLVSFHYPVRMSYYAPAHIDVWDKVWLVAGLIVISRYNVWRNSLVIACLCIITAVGAIFRDVVLVIPLCFLVVRNPITISWNPFRLRLSQPPPAAFYLPLACGVLSFLALRFILITPGGSYTFGRAVARHLYTIIPFDYVYAWFIAFGPVIVLALYNWRSVGRFLWERQFLLVYFILFAVLSYIGGESTYRYVRWEFPLVFVFIAKAIEERAILFKSPIFISILAVTQLVSQRAFWATPDYPGGKVTLLLLTPIGNNVPLLDVIGMGGREVRFIALCQYLLLSLLLVLYLNWRKKRLALVSPGRGREG